MNGKTPPKDLYAIPKSRFFALAKGERVEIRELCSFFIKEYGSYIGWNPKTGQRVKIDYNDRFTSMARSARFVFNKRFIWDKQRIWMGYNGRNRYDQILFLSKGARRMPRDLSIPDVLAHKIHPKKRIHPAEKPVELIKDLIRFCSEPGEVVLDPFAGSMATARGRPGDRTTHRRRRN